jgi:hypothetical protein
MDLDDILRLLALLFFVVIPILRSIAKRAQKMQPPKPTPPTGTTRPGSPVVTVPTSTVSTTTLSADFEKKLSEARRKVQEAMQQQGGHNKQAPTDVGQESTRGMFRTPTAKPTPPVFSSPIPDEFRQKAPASGLVIPEVSHKGLTVAPPLQKITSRTAKNVKLDKHVLLSKDMLSEQELTRGLLWLHILSEPKSKQRRRSLSQHR